MRTSTRRDPPAHRVRSRWFRMLAVALLAGAGPVPMAAAVAVRPQRVAPAPFRSGSQLLAAALERGDAATERLELELAADRALAQLLPRLELRSTTVGVGADALAEAEGWLRAARAELERFVLRDARTLAFDGAAARLLLRARAATLALSDAVAIGVAIGAEPSGAEPGGAAGEATLERLAELERALGAHIAAARRTLREADAAREALLARLLASPQGTLPSADELEAVAAFVDGPLAAARTAPDRLRSALLAEIRTRTATVATVQAARTETLSRLRSLQRDRREALVERLFAVEAKLVAIASQTSSSSALAATSAPASPSPASGPATSTSRPSFAAPPPRSATSWPAASALAVGLLVAGATLGYGAGRLRPGQRSDPHGGVAEGAQTAPEHGSATPRGSPDPG